MDYKRDALSSIKKDAKKGLLGKKLGKKEQRRIRISIGIEPEHFESEEEEEDEED